jgi:hypothetical protein
MPDVTLSTFNTITLTANTVYRLVPLTAGSYYINMLNLGPGTLYIRTEADPSPNDPQSETLPSGLYDNQMPLDSTKGVRILSDQAGAVTARLVIR